MIYSLRQHRVNTKSIFTLYWVCTRNGKAHRSLLVMFDIAYGRRAAPYRQRDMLHFAIYSYRCYSRGLIARLAILRDAIASLKRLCNAAAVSITIDAWLAPRHAGDLYMHMPVRDALLRSESFKLYIFVISIGAHKDDIDNVTCIFLLELHARSRFYMKIEMAWLSQMKRHVSMVISRDGHRSQISAVNAS